MGRNKAARTLAVLTLLMAAATTGFADALFDFESPLPSGSSFYADPGCVAALSTEQAYSLDTSVELALNDSDNYARLAVNVDAGTLADFEGSFQAYVDYGRTNTSGEATLAPYMMIGLDADGNGVFDNYDGGDPLVIAFITGGGSYALDTWFQTGLDGSTTVHVVNNRTGLAAGTYSSSGTQDTVDNLSLLDFDGSRSWGDLEVVQVRIATGLWPSTGTENYRAFVDDLQVTSPPVPEPASLSILGLALAGIAGRRFLRRRHSA